MSVGGVGARSLLLTKSLVDMRSQLGDLQRQLATGKKSVDYAGIGIDRGLTVGLRSRLSAMKSYGESITNVGVRLELAQSTLGRVAELGREIKTAAAPVNSAGPEIMQRQALSSLGEIFGILNTQAGDRYLFSGLAADTAPVETLDHIL
jgi:flagellar hook-associated protein 3 FlgL